MPSESIESQLAEEKCLMEQKYASMLQQVLAQKQLVSLGNSSVDLSNASEFVFVCLVGFPFLLDTTR